MFTADAARIIGITPKALRVFLRNRSKGVGSGARYEFSYAEVEKLKKAYWVNQTPQRGSGKRQKWLGDGGSPGLDIEWLTNPDKQALFIAERQARLERLNDRLREAGLDVPQMNEQTLKINNRALALVQVLGLTE